MLLPQHIYKSGGKSMFDTSMWVIVMRICKKRIMGFCPCCVCVCVCICACLLICRVGSIWGQVKTGTRNLRSFLDTVDVSTSKGAITAKNTSKNLHALQLGGFPIDTDVITKETNLCWNVWKSGRISYTRNELRGCRSTYRPDPSDTFFKCFFYCDAHVLHHVRKSEETIAALR